MRKRHPVPAFAAGFLLALALAVGALAAILWVLGTNAGLMTRIMTETAPDAIPLLPGSVYPAICEAITSYLAGGTSVFGFEFAGVQLFGEKERIHMADCAALFRLDRTVLIVCCAAAVVLIAVLILMRSRKSAAAGVLTGTLAALVLAAVLGVWGLVDFDGLFTAFHRTFFTNDLWLMNPATDVIIRLMPEAFFIRCALLGGGAWLAFLALTALVSGLLARGNK